MKERGCRVVSLSEDELLEMTIYLVTSARNCVDEPELYGSFRLVRAVSKLLKLGKGYEGDVGEFWQGLESRIDEAKLSLDNPASYVEFLDDLTSDLVREL